MNYIIKDLYQSTFYDRYIFDLYSLLKEREVWQSISHKKMPKFEEHKKFVKSYPYAKWWVITNKVGDLLGTIYRTRQNEIGLFIFKKHQTQGIGVFAIDFIKLTYPARTFYANISPLNELSVKFFKKHGFKHIQNTYKYTPIDV